MSSDDIWLRPCPFCGGRVERVRLLDSDIGRAFNGMASYKINCWSCKVIFDVLAVDETGAVAKFNRRASQQA